MLSSVFHIFSKKIEPDNINLWNIGDRISTAGSAFGVNIKDIKYIITNSHVSENSNYIECVKYNSDKRYALKIIDNAPEVDLSLLAVSETDYKEFWDNVPIMTIASPPQRGESVKVVGFPQSGSNPSITKGIVSRIISMLYSKSVLNLAIQVDSAINPGNSGGPVFNNSDEIVGVAFSHSIKGQNICYIIPSFIIIYYINSIIKFGGSYGVCDLDIETNTLENESIRDYYFKNKSETSGILVTRVNPIGSLNHILKKDDIIHEIDNIPISNDQTILIENYKIVSKPSTNTEKVPFWYILRCKLPDEKIDFKITRGKKIMNITCKTAPSAKKLIPLLNSHINRSYYIFAGLIFIPLNFWYLFRVDEFKKLTPDLEKIDLFKYLNMFPENIDDEIVILSDILQTTITSGYRLENIRLLKINDIDIKNIKHVHELCESCKDKFIKFEFENSNIVIINTKLAKNTSENISQKYLGIKYTNI